MLLPKTAIFTKSFSEKGFEPHFIFDRRVYEKEPHKDCVYEINEIYRYICRDNRWSVERFTRKRIKQARSVWFKGNRQRIAAEIQV
ncbi:MAG: hypothetical protein ACLR56_08695 [Oscillospiraceae bacterium]